MLRGAGYGADLTAGGPGAVVFVPSASIVDLAGNAAVGSFTTAASFRLFNGRPCSSRMGELHRTSRGRPCGRIGSPRGLPGPA